MDLAEQPMTLERMIAYLSDAREGFHKETCERMGASSTAANFQALLKQTEHVDSEKFTAFLVGLSPEVFAASLSFLDEHQLYYLKSVSINEPVLHHLTLFGHSINKTLARIDDEAIHIESAIQMIDPLKEADNEGELFTNLLSLSAQISDAILALSNALLIAWNSDRQELIFRLSNLKESALRTSLFIGSESNYSTASKGLFKLLEDKLMTVYSGKVADTDPAIEALAILGIIYEEDFIEAGLLDNVRENKSCPYLQDVEQRLSMLGLVTVGDVKKNHIFSRTTLLKFIARARTLLRL